ncbi:NAD(P)/FAD-dependent oxidoreductase [Halotalea alkalilenta]|uniref:NAD(P)/FAD-dependent oxidoreductase n=1 Tax=Halotalea alkalilenta TaxID=376489 RepID=UPI00047FE52C|nr:NAD(P)/FAD-dependent oxidoreductase [Halotalea alkalilenta]
MGEGYSDWDVVVIGAGAAGMMCAHVAGYRGRRVLLVEHAKRAGKKILMSGGGRCNFTNLDAAPRHYFGANPRFCISAMKRYSPYDFLELVERHGIEHVEKAPGQLFCADSAKPIVEMLLTECEWAGVETWLSTTVERIEPLDPGFELLTSRGRVRCGSLVIATGGLSIPTLGASGFGYQVARQFGLEVLPTRPALVPFTLTSQWKSRFEPLAGIATPVIARCNGASYREPLLVTHRGLSGPAMLQASSHWLPGDALEIDWLDGSDAKASLFSARIDTPRRSLGGWLSDRLPKRLALALAQWACEAVGVAADTTLADLSNARLEALATQLCRFSIKPAGTEGWRTAEVTMGGVDTQAFSSKDCAVRDVPGLYFIGEVLDVTGQLGGYNFQWAWASGVACGQSA